VNSDASAARDTDYPLIAQIARQPLRWQLVVVIGQPRKRGDGY
jgi:hypothetical protein